jgi:hypothetical protein
VSSTASTTILSLLLAVCTSCTKATSAGDEGAGAKPRPQPGDLTVELSGVTLGDDCGASWTPPPPAAPRTAAATEPPSEAPSAAPMRRAAPSTVAPSEAPAGACPVGDDCGRHYRACQQTSIQLALHATATTGATPIKIKKVELLDAKGKSLGELTAKTPTRWSDAGSYQAWDQMIAPGEHAAVSYVLSTPSWHAMEGGQYAQTGKTFQVRVTVLVGAKDRVVEKKAIQPAIMPPPAPT